jgi:hypothetical protein
VVPSFLAAGTSGLPVTAVTPPTKSPERLLLVAADMPPKLKEQELGAIALELRRPVGSKLTGGWIILSVANSEPVPVSELGFRRGTGVGTTRGGASPMTHLTRATNPLPDSCAGSDGAVLGWNRFMAFWLVTRAELNGAS